MALKLKRESALNLTLEGSTGSFSVGSGQTGQNSIEVKYFLTHVGLDFSSSSDEALLSQLAPVREIFDVNQLDFDEIMQRDIDDARVSSELIPYLLDEKSVDLVKLFPPVVVVVLPIQDGQNRPAPLYPKVTTEELEDDDKQLKYILRSGGVGQEVFQFEQPIDEGQKLKHDLVRLRLNSHKTRLVIVDGQHRAMALLALYRNLKDQWSDERRAPFKEYYSEWTVQYIQQFNLKEINLPIILCTFPSLDDSYTGGFDLKKAARAIFLTLNKTARKVSNSRNILLDDNDIIALFLRRCLSEVKQKDVRSPSSFRIYNVELDQFGDKMKIQSPIAITGVNHLYYMIEHLLLNSGSDIDGVKPRSGNFAIRTNLNTYVCMDRLDGRNLLGADVANATKRDSFLDTTAEMLSSSFNEKYGKFLISVYEKFIPYENHNRAVLSLENRIESNQDRQLRPILFEGQGISRVFEAHRTNLKDKLKDGTFSTKVPEIQAIANRLDATAKRIEEAISSLRSERAEFCIQVVTDKSELKVDGKVHPEVIKWFNDLYDNVLTTVAFQSGIICGFFGELEKANREIQKTNNDQQKSDPMLSTDECFEEYIQQLNSFFVPKRITQLKCLIRLFTGEPSRIISEWRVISNNQTFREVVYRGEMQPDLWAKYKYLLLEIWKPSNVMLSQVIENERQKCRKQIFSSLHDFYKARYCRDNSKLEESLDGDEWNSIFNRTVTAFNGLLKNIGALELDESQMKMALSVLPATYANEPEE